MGIVPFQNDKKIVTNQYKDKLQELIIFILGENGTDHIKTFGTISAYYKALNLLRKHKIIIEECEKLIKLYESFQKELNEEMKE
jgi:hypothetical protein